MITIGRFSDATGLTVKALRHYDEIGLLAPAHVDPDSGYRYYDSEQIEEGVAIRRLRALELPLDEIRGLLDADADGIRDRLAAHGYRVAEELRDKHSLLMELAALVEGGDAPLDIDIVELPELRLAGTIRHRPLIDPEGVADMLRAARERLAELGVAPSGPATGVFRGGDGDGTHLAEVGYPIAGALEDALLSVRVYPAARGAVYEHRGGYSELPVVSKRFIATVLGQGLQFGQPIRIEWIERDARARLVWPLAD
jgi:DNA-binding transcriptional MerR regulator